MRYRKENPLHSRKRRQKKLSWPGESARCRGEGQGGCFRPGNFLIKQTVHVSEEPGQGHRGFSNAGFALVDGNGPRWLGPQAFLCRNINPGGTGDLVRWAFAIFGGKGPFPCLAKIGKMLLHARSNPPPPQNLHPQKRFFRGPRRLALARLLLPGPQALAGFSPARTPAGYLSAQSAGEWDRRPRAHAARKVGPRARARIWPISSAKGQGPR